MKATIITQPVRTTNTSEPVGNLAPVHPTLIKKKELAQRLSVSPRTIDGWMSRRLIPYIHASPRFHLFEFDAVLAALKKHYQVNAVERD